LWENEDASRLPKSSLAKIRLILTLLNGAKKIGDINFPGSNLHQLKGEYSGYWTIKVTGNYRMIFRFANEKVYDLDFVDYH